LGRRGRRGRADRRGLFLVVFAEDRIELVAAAAGRSAERQGERDCLRPQPP